MKTVAANPFRGFSAQGRRGKHAVGLFALALFTILQLLRFHSFVGRPTFHDGDEVECLGASSDPVRCHEARIFRQWHDDSTGAPDITIPPPTLQLADSPRTSSTVDNAQLPSHVHNLQTLLATSRVSKDEPTTTAATRVMNSSQAVVAAPAAEFEKVADQLMSSMVWTTYANGSSSQDLDQAWTQNVVQMQARLEDRMKNLKLLQQDLGKPKMMTASEPSVDHHERLTSWATDLMSLQERLQNRANDLKAKHRAHHPSMPASASFAPEASASTTNVMQQIWDYGVELCKDPRRRSRPSCAEFLMGSSVASDTLLAEPTGEALNSVPVSSSDGLTRTSRYETQHNLHWGEVQSWQAASTAASLRGGHLAKHGFATVTKDDLQRSKWGGMIPKVACISVLPVGRDIQHQLRYFLDAFKLQNYEGPRQLVLVYQHEDPVVKELVKQYADGVLVKVVAAMGSMNEQSLAYRYGAWAAKDADIIARWDFDAWHHPSRLSMQVRALALAKRPASRLGKVTQKTQADALGEPSIIGEKEWMNQFWFPLRSNEAVYLSKVHREHFVEVESPELLLYNTGPLV